MYEQTEKRPLSEGENLAYVLKQAVTKYLRREMSENQLSVIGKALEWGYEKAVTGGGVLGTAQSLGDEYLRSNNYNKKDAANSLIRWQNTKAATGGFVTNLGGAITIPIAIPANMASTLYIQLRMIAAIAHIGGHDVLDDKTKTLCFVCLTGNSAARLLSRQGFSLERNLQLPLSRSMLPEQ
ncbi:hypothetical protein [Komagataeibacter kakiaceti]|uniref:hypothetical protein n=1 Tax=Komagataeibacter kakiaceti TaxID=943261 RepID=UPI0019017127|nr:hypothetical protein [Komagataeibacter kakiaceti]